jgi:hypothetical protein
MRWAETNTDEAEFRDGLHGGLVWAVGVVITASLLLSAAGSVVRTGTEAAGRAVSAANADPLAYQIDTLLRAAARSTAPGNTPAGSPAQPNSDLRAELLRIFGRSIANGSLAEADRAYVGSVVSQRTGLPQQDADRRVTEAYAEATGAAKAAAESARRSAILVGLVTAVSLIVSLGAAWWAAVNGGNHRDNSIPARFNLPLHRRPAT